MSGLEFGDGWIDKKNQKIKKIAGANLSQFLTNFQNIKFSKKKILKKILGSAFREDFVEPVLVGKI